MSKHLSAYSVAKTQSVDEMRSVLFDVYDARTFDITGDESQFSAEAAYCGLPASNLSYCAHKSPVTIEFRDDDYIRLQLAVAGAGRTRFGGHSCDVGPATIVCSPADARMEFGATLEQFSLRLDRTALEQDLAALLGTRPRDPITFSPAVDASGGAAARLRLAILQAASMIDVGEDAMPAPMLATIERSLRLNTLYGMPNNYSDRLNAPVREAAPWQVLRVEQWIDAHWRENVSIDDLIDISGVSGRSIFAAFKKARGYTPMAYLKKVRLEAAQRMLLAARPGDSVTGIGLACHFANLGHFARDYHNQFGERPSETLANTRRIAA